MRTLIPAAMIAVVVALAAGCGGGSDSSSSGDNGSSAVSGNTITISMKDFSLTPSDITVDKPGEYTINATNDGESPHAIGIDGNGVDEDGETVEAGGTSTITVNLETPGEYKIYCPVGNHESLGMEGTLTVKSASP